MTAGALTEADLAGATDGGRFARGADYVRYVHGLRVGAGWASATVQAKRVYEVRLEWSTDVLSGRCTCPDATDLLCKHLVALGLAVLDAEQGQNPVDGETAALTGYLSELEQPELVALVRQLIARDPEGRAEVLARAAAAGHGDAVDPDALVVEVNEALSVRGFVDYRRSFDVARDVEQVLDRLTRLLDAGAADAVRPALLRAVSRLRVLTERADDSGGVLGDSAQRAVDLYARACREGAPDPAALARWLLKFRKGSPGWPEVTLAAFVPALDERALRSYRRGVAGWAESLRDAEPIQRHDVEAALLELLDHDGDLDGAVALLTRHPGHEQYGEVVRRLDAAGRKAEALRWLDRAVQADRVTGFGASQRSGYRLAPSEAVELYLESGQEEDALAVLQQDFSRRPGVASWRALLDLAARLGREVEQRAWATAQAERQAAGPYSSGAALVEIALAEGRLDDAWQVVDRYGAGHAWEALVRASATERPARAAELVRPHVEQLLVHADSTKYAPAAVLLGQMRDLFATAGQVRVFEDYLADLRSRYARRPSLLAALDRRGLH